MKSVALLLLVAAANHVQGASDDYHVEQVRSPYVSPMDQGTHMTSRNAGRSQGLQGSFGPYGSSSKHEVHEEQRYVNGQPVYEKRHERRFEDGRLVHEDGHEKGHPELASAHLLGSSSGYGTGGGAAGEASGSNSYRSSSSRRYESSGSGYGGGSSLEGGGFEGANVNVHSNIGRYGDSGAGYGGAGSTSSSRSSTSSSRTSLVAHTPEDFEDTFRTDVDRLRQRLHQGTAVIREPVTGTSLHEESRQEARFVNGQQVYHKKEERRFEDGRLVHDISDETGDQNAGVLPTVAIGGGVNSASTLRRSGYESSVASGSQGASTSEYNPPSNTAYRASYWRPGPQERRVSTTSQRRTSQVSSGYQPGDARVRPATGRSPYQSAYRTSTNRIRTEGNKPAYRASYTPSRTLERVPQRVDSVAPAVTSQVSSASSQSQYSSTSSGYQAVNPTTQRPVASQSVSESSEYRRSYANRHYAGAPEPGPAVGPSYQPRPGAASPSNRPNPERAYPYQPSSQSAAGSATSRREFSTTYGTGSYVRPTEAPATAHTTSRITDTYSEPYSVRSSSYQPSRFANYSAWSHWKKESNQPSQPISGAASSQSQYSQSNNLRSSVDDRAVYPSENTYRYPAASQTSTSQRTNQQSQTVRAFRPGFLYNEQETENNEIEDGEDQGYASSRSQSSQYDGYSSGSSYPASSSTRSSQSDYSSGSYTSNTPRTTDGSIGAVPGGQVALSITLNAGQGDTFRVGSASTSETEETDQERYDISPLDDGGVDLSADNEVETEYAGGRASSSSVRSGSSSNFNSQYGGNVDFHSNAPSPSGQAGYSSERAYDSSSSRYNEDLYPVSGSSYDRTTRITNRTTNTLTSQVQPLVSSYKLEIRSSKRYLNGKLVSETRYNRYYENGVMIHENQTERSRDEMLTDGVDVEALDLTTEDLAAYGLLEAGNQEAMSHSQRFEMRQEKEFVDGNQVFEATHSKRYQDGELIQESHDEKDRDTLASMGMNSHHNSGTGSSIAGQPLVGGSYSSNFIQNRNYGSSIDTGSYTGPPRGGARQNTGIGETVTVSLSPRTRTRKTEIRQEQEFRDGEQVYDLRHERQFDDGQLVHEDLSEKGPDELGSTGHNDALQDILSGQTLGTASQSGYRPSPAAVASKQRQESSYSVDGSVNTLNRGGDYEYTSSQNRAYDAGHEVDRTSNSYQGSSVESRGSQSTQGQIGTNLLTSGCLTCVIGGNGVERLDSLANAPSLSTGSSSSSSSSTADTTRYGGSNTRQGVSGGGYYSMVGGGSGGSGSGYGGASGGSGSLHGGTRTGSGYGAGSSTSTSSTGGYSSESSSSSYGSGRSEYGSGGRDLNYGSAGAGRSGYQASTSFGAEGGGYGGGHAVTHRREMEMEERYENGQLVSGREEDKEWKNDDLIKHEQRRYGDGDESRRYSSSALTSPGLSSSSTYQSSGSSNQGVTNFGASASFGAQTHGYGGGGDSAGYGSRGVGYQQGGVGYQEGSLGGSGGVLSHRREMEMEEHYENGQLVSGREEDKEWKNDELLRHDHRRYGGEGGMSRSLPSSSIFSDSDTGRCSARPCLNGGSCIPSSTGYMCICTFGFKGLACEEAYCPARFCRNDGICQVTQDGGHECSCPVQFTGPRCEVRVRSRGRH